MKVLTQSVISVDSRVTMVIDGKEQVWTIVPEGKSEISKGHISVDAPFAKLLMGHTEGETVSGKILEKQIIIKIKKIIPPRSCLEE